MRVIALHWKLHVTASLASKHLYSHKNWQEACPREFREKNIAKTCDYLICIPAGTWDTTLSLTQSICQKRIFSLDFFLSSTDLLTMGWDLSGAWNHQHLGRSKTSHILWACSCPPMCPSKPALCFLFHLTLRSQMFWSSVVSYGSSRQGLGWSLYLLQLAVLSLDLEHVLVAFS